MPFHPPGPEALCVKLVSGVCSENSYGCQDGTPGNPRSCRRSLRMSYRDLLVSFLAHALNPWAAPSGLERPLNEP